MINCSQSRQTMKINDHGKTKKINKIFIKWNITKHSIYKYLRISFYFDLFMKIYSNKKMHSTLHSGIILLTILITTTLCLHVKKPTSHLQTTSDQTQQLNYLINMQNNYASGVKALTDEVKTTRLKIQQTNNIDEKVKLLQAAIIKQRSKIGQMNSKLLPDPTSDFSQCVPIPQDQRRKLDQQVFEIQSTIQEFQQIARTIPTQVKITQINDELNNMKIKLDGIQRVKQKQCEKNLAKSTAVYQTNLYQNNNWVLGTLTMDQLIDEFYRRSLANDNITNCPLDRPFLKSQSIANSPDLCIKCPAQSPYFDMSSKNCIACPAGKQMNLQLRNCAVVPKNSIYNETGRYRIQPLSEIPAPNPHLENCPTNNPYFNGTACVSCPGDSYWQISQSKCFNCPQYSSFNIATRQCQANPFIYVNGSRDRLLATENRSIADYDKYLKDSISKNPTSMPKNCSDPTAYAAVTACIICNPNSFQYFNVETLTCSYCDGYLDPVTNKCKLKVYYFPNFDAPNLLYINKDYNSSKASAQAEVQKNPNTTGYCPLNTPYPKQSRLECMNCTTENPLYLAQQYNCTKCPQLQGYDPVQRRCRVVIYLTDYNSNAIITPPNSLQTYLNAEAQVNKTNLTKKCLPDRPFTIDGVSCINCPAETPFFDLNTKNCIGCPVGTQYMANRKGCFNVAYFTDLTASRLLQVDNYTVVNVSKQQQALKADPNKPLYAICPLEKPYGTLYGCVNCSQNTYFNLKSKNCQPCPAYFTYWSPTRKCVQQSNVTNLSAANLLVQDQNYTLAAYTNEIQNIKKQGPYLICPADKPYSINGVCMPCVEPNSYFLLSTRNCGPCGNFQADTKTCPPKPNRYSNLSNYRWITNDGNPDRIINMVYTQKSQATASKCLAFYNQRTKDCVNCQQNYYYNFDTGNCERCVNNTVFDLNTHKCTTAETAGVYFTNINSAQSSQLIYGGLTFDELNKTQTRQMQKNPSSTFCPNDRPFYDNISCMKCPEYKKYFNLRYNLCQVCLANQKLSDHNCISSNSTIVWEEPVPEHVYPFLFNSL